MLNNIDIKKLYDTGGKCKGLPSFPSILKLGSTYLILSVAGFGLRLASTGTFGCYMFDSVGSTYGIGYALRPVVSLPSSLLTGEKTNDAWNLSK